MIDYLKELFYESRLKKEITENLVKYLKSRTDSQAICFRLNIKHNEYIDYSLRKFKRKFFKLDNDYLKVQLLNYYINMMIYLVYQNKNIFYDPDDHLNRW